MTLAPFTLSVPRPQGPLLSALETALAADGPMPVRWAVVAAGPTHLLIEGARWCPPSPSST